MNESLVLLNIHMDLLEDVIPARNGIPEYYKLTMIVTQMNEEFRYDDNTGKFPFFKHNDMVVKSVGCPELSDNTVYLWGNTPSKDSLPAIKTFSTRVNMERYHERVVDLIMHWNTNYPWVSQSKQAIKTEKFFD